MLPNILQGTNFYIRANKRDGTTVALRGHPTDPWFFHPTEKEDVDAAVTLFSPLQLAELDIEHIPLAMFTDRAVIMHNNLGVGDEVFITGLFTKVTETSKNIPIVRTGTVAMIPGEKIPWRDRYIDAYLIEARSIGGLSGSPVFIRETLAMSMSTSPIVEPGRNRTKFLHGLGHFYFFGSLIGHWDVPEGFSPTQAETVNMGIAPVVPASKIREILFQPELAEIMKKVNDEMRAKNQTGARLDFAPSEQGETQITDGGATIPVPTARQFFEVVKKASRKKA